MLGMCIRASDFPVTNYVLVYYERSRSNCCEYEKRKISKRNARNPRKPRNTRGQTSYPIVFFNLKRTGRTNLLNSQKRTKGTKHTKAEKRNLDLLGFPIPLLEPEGQCGTLGNGGQSDCPPDAVHSHTPEDGDKIG